jgi:hypothetical protein
LGERRKNWGRPETIKPLPYFFEKRSGEGLFRLPRETSGNGKSLNSVERHKLPLGDISFRGLQRIEFEGIFLDFLLDVSGKIAVPLRPFQ